MFISTVGYQANLGKNVVVRKKSKAKGFSIV